MQQYFYINYKIGDIDLFGKGKIGDFFRKGVFQFKFVVSDCII